MRISSFLEFVEVWELLSLVCNSSEVCCTLNDKALCWDRASLVVIVFFPEKHIPKSSGAIQAHQPLCSGQSVNESLDQHQATGTGHFVVAWLTCRSYPELLVNCGSSLKNPQGHSEMKIVHVIAYSNDLLSTDLMLEMEYSGFGDQNNACRCPGD